MKATTTHNSLMPMTGSYGDSVKTVNNEVRQLLLDPLSDRPEWMTAESFKQRRVEAYNRNVKSREVEFMKAEEKQFRGALAALRRGEKLTLGWF